MGSTNWQRPSSQKEDRAATAAADASPAAAATHTRHNNSNLSPLLKLPLKEKLCLSKTPKQKRMP
jgi:hypothetical protein